MFSTYGPITAGAITGTSLSAGAGNILGGNVTATGTVSAASVTATGAVQGGSVTATGAVTGGSLSLTGANSGITSIGTNKWFIKETNTVAGSTTPGTTSRLCFGMAGTGANATDQYFACLDQTGNLVAY
jgi:hypothetical protein